MKLLYLKMTNGYCDSFTYQENVLPGKYVKLGYDTYLFTSVRSSDKDGKPLDREPETYVNEHGVTITILPFSRKYGKFARKYDIYDNLYEEIEKLGPDVIFTHSPQFFSITQVAEYVKKHPGVKWYVDNHGDHKIQPVNTLKRKVYHRLILKEILKKCRPYVTKFYGVSPSRSEYLHEVYGIPMSQIETIKQGGDEDVVARFDRVVERQALREKLNIPPEDLVVISGAGNMDEKKKVHCLLEAVYQMPGVSLVLFGSFSEEGKSLAEKWLDGGNIHFVGRLHGDEMVQYFAASELAIFPGQHSVLWDQAVATGIPLLLRYWKGMDYFNINGNCRYLQEGSAMEIRESLTQLLANDRQALKEMQRAAEGEAAKQFSYIEIAKQTLQI